MRIGPRCYRRRGDRTRLRSRWPKRVASAVGEGAMAVQFVHEHLKEMWSSRAFTGSGCWPCRGGIKWLRGRTPAWRCSGMRP